MSLWEYLAVSLLFCIFLLIALVVSGFYKAFSVLGWIKRLSSQGRPQIVVAKGKLLGLVVYMPPADS